MSETKVLVVHWIYPQIKWKNPSIGFCLSSSDDGTCYWSYRKKSGLERLYSCSAWGWEGRTCPKQKKFEAIYIIDVMLPKWMASSLQLKSGLWWQYITHFNVSSIWTDRCRVFKIGCDDYITKPFSLMELDYRIRAILKRTYKTPGNEEPPCFSESVFLSSITLRIFVRGQKRKKLTRKEGELLRLFCEKKMRLSTEILSWDHVWVNDDYFIFKEYGSISHQNSTFAESRPEPWRSSMFTVPVTSFWKKIGTFISLIRNGSFS